MTTTNPFDLDKKKSGIPANKVLARTWTEEEQAERLTGYIEVPEDLWPLLKVGQHVRYVTKDEKYHPGGFILLNPFQYTPRDTSTPVQCIKLHNSFNRSDAHRVEWPVGFDTILHLYMKLTVEGIISIRCIENAVGGLNTNIRKLTDYTKKLEARVRELERT